MPLSILIDAHSNRDLDRDPDAHTASDISDSLTHSVRDWHSVSAGSHQGLPGRRTARRQLPVRLPRHPRADEDADRAGSRVYTPALQRRRSVLLRGPVPRRLRYAVRHSDTHADTNTDCV